MIISTLKIDLLRAEQQLTCAALAERSGVSRQQISTILRRGTCNPLTAAKLAQGLGVSVTDIIRENADARPGK